jgi:formate dehydrogenase maturation protein FdhE
MNRAHAEITRYSEIMPEYRESLLFLRKILEFQSSLADKINPGADKRMAEQKFDFLEACKQLRSGQPLFENMSVPISPSLFRKALDELRFLLPQDSTRSALDRLLALKHMAPENVETVLNELKTDSDSCIKRLAKATSTQAGVLQFLLQTVLSPFFENQAGFYRDLVDSDSWRHGKCPMCGSEPAIARLAGDDGQRILACSLCHTEWAFDRLRCPFCESEEQPFLRHFTVNDDKAHRVDCCNKCRRYLKVVDERIHGRPASLPVENIITYRLDVLAREQGYQ